MNSDSLLQKSQVFIIIPSRAGLWREEFAAAWWIGGESPDLIATFEQGLRAADQDSREIAVATPSEMASESQTALRLLLRALDDPAMPIRLQVFQSISALGAKAASATPALLTITTNRLYFMRIGATQTLAAIRAQALPSPK